MPCLFSLGRTVATPGAVEALARNNQSAAEFLRRHQAGDWGDISEGDRHENELSVKIQLTILSVYRLRDETKIFVITEGDRSSTCILLPEEY